MYIDFFQGINAQQGSLVPPQCSYTYSIQSFLNSTINNCTEQGYCSVTNYCTVKGKQEHCESCEDINISSHEQFFLIFFAMSPMNQTLVTRLTATITSARVQFIRTIRTPVEATLLTVRAVTKSVILMIGYLPLISLSALNQCR